MKTHFCHTSQRYHFRLITSKNTSLSSPDPLCAIDGEEVVYVNVGSSHTINCSITSPDPPHHVFWFFNEKVLLYCCTNTFLQC